jgi:hypothetical protein
MIEILKNCPQRLVSQEDETYDVCRAVLRQRKKRRIANLELFLAFLRCLQLVKSLRLTRFKNTFLLFLNKF